MPGHPASAAADLLPGLLAQELLVLRRFVTLLEREQALLGEANAEPLTTLAAEKSATAGELTQLAEARESRLKSLGHPAGRPGMEAWLASPVGANQRTAWLELLDLAGKARALNETNGRLIALHLQHNRRALATLAAAAEQAMTYGPDGQQRAGGGGRSLGSA